MYESFDIAGLMAELVSIERDAAVLSGRRIRTLATIHAAEQAERATEVAAGRGPRPGDSATQREHHWVSEEVALVLRVAGVTAQDRLLHADQVVRRLGDSLRLLEAGDVHPVQVQRLSEAVIGLTDEQCADVQTRMLTRVAADPGLSISGFSRSLKRAVMRAAPKTAEQAHADALTELRVEVRPLEHGIALLMAWLPAPDAWRIKADIEHRAKQFSGPARPADPTADAADTNAASTIGVGANGATANGASANGARDDRCGLADVRRAYALIELIDLGAASDPAAVAARPAPAVAVTVSLDTLLGISDEPGELSGCGPIPASMARQVAADPNCTWVRLVTDPLGQLIDYGRERYKPPPELDEFIRGRDQICSFPNCHRRAISCELDHIQAWADGGETKATNLTALCPRHHHAKHDAGWQLRRDNVTGISRWISPTRNRYVNQPAELPGTTR